MMMPAKKMLDDGQYAELFFEQGTSPLEKWFGLLFVPSNWFRESLVDDRRKHRLTFGAHRYRCIQFDPSNANLHLQKLHLHGHPDFHSWPSKTYHQMAQDLLQRYREACPFCCTTLVDKNPCLYQQLRFVHIILPKLEFYMHRVQTIIIHLESE